ncbi:Mu transposase C-terminal domain-containing protein, partial [Nonomuraea sp. MTCD27]|uniref:Mu transposase C-terminal domain-containing protein n=1 Tax=Nonomuraea sp. MTCD27 TaxID=1676747 RepID=UPI0035C25062
LREPLPERLPERRPGAAPRPQYDPALNTLRERDAAKAAELTAAGKPTSAITVQRMRARYRVDGLRGLVDGRLIKPVTPFGKADPRLVKAIADAVAAETDRSTGTRERLRRQVEKLVRERHGDDVALPSKATFNRLVGAISNGRHTFGTATTRRSLANRPERPFTVTLAARPGQQVQIDTTVLDVLALFDDGQARRVELTAAIDIATRTICAAVLRPEGTKAVDAALVLARMLVPEPMRPGWAEVLRMSAARLPHRRLADIDARLENAAAKPVIVPETIVCDRGRVYVSQTFERACESLGISLQPAHPYSGSDKGVIEATFDAINTLFCQHVAGYVGSNATHRGKDAAIEARWSMAQLQDLLDEWIIAGWQTRLHDGIRSPDTNQPLSPNEMYAVLVSAAGYVPVVLSGEDYLELLPAEGRTINDYGIRLQGRTYDSRELNPHRRQHSGIQAHKGLWEVRYDPYDATQIWVRDHHAGGWLRAVWTHLPMVSAPFADFTWRHARQVAGPDASETEIARTLDDLLTRAADGPADSAASKTDQRVIARTRAASGTQRPPLEPGVEEPADSRWR